MKNINFKLVIIKINELIIKHIVLLLLRVWLIYTKIV